MSKVIGVVLLTFLMVTSASAQKFEADMDYLDATARVALIPPGHEVCVEAADVYDIALKSTQTNDAMVFKEYVKDKFLQGRCGPFPGILAYIRTLTTYKDANGDSVRLAEVMWKDHPGTLLYMPLPSLPPGVFEIGWTPGIFDQLGTDAQGPTFYKITEAERKWFQDGFVQSCCNLGDAFISDLFFEKDGKFYAEITDGYDHHPNVQKGVIPPGTIREIPEAVMKKMQARDKSGNMVAPQNPTSHGIIFLHLIYDSGNVRGYRFVDGHGESVAPADAEVLCYWPPSSG